MKDETENQKPDLRTTIEAIGLMYSSLKSLHERVYPQNPMWFAIMGQGPIDDIRNLLDDVEGLMKDMVPQQLREDAAKLREAGETRASALEETA